MNLDNEALEALNTIPEHLHGGILRYVEDRVRPGMFLESVVSNDLRGSVALADRESLQALGAIVQWFYNHAPSPCWGSPERFQKWLDGAA